MKTKKLAAIAVLAIAASASQASAQAFLPVLTFEGPDVSGAADGGEGLGVNNGGVLGSFGATEGTTALVFDNALAANQVFFDIGTVNGDPVPPNDPERLANYAVIAAAAAAAEAGQDVKLNFDVTYDASGVTNEGFLQVGVFINSEAGFDALWFGGLVGGNIGFTGTFPTLAPAAAAGGVTMTVLDPSNYLAGDNLGAVRFSIPVGPSEILLLSSGGDPGFDFAQLGFNRNSGYGGVVDFAFDNVGFEIIPEPTAGAIMVVAGLALAASGRRRK
jgi:hypothetical protein